MFTLVQDKTYQNKQSAARFPRNRMSPHTTLWKRISICTESFDLTSRTVHILKEIDWSAGVSNYSVALAMNSAGWKQLSTMFPNFSTIPNSERGAWVFSIYQSSVPFGGTLSVVGGVIPRLDGKPARRIL